MCIIQIILSISLFILGIAIVCNIYNEIKEDYKYYNKQICIDCHQIFMFIIGIVLIVFSYKLFII